MIQLLVSLINVRKRRVPRTDPWGTPLTTGSLLDDSPSRTNCCIPGTPVSSTNKKDHHHITEILLKVALNTIIITHIPNPKHLVDQLVCINKTQIYNLVRMMRYWNVIHQVSSKSKDWKTNLIEKFLGARQSTDLFMSKNK